MNKENKYRICLNTFSSRNTISFSLRCRYFDAVNFEYFGGLECLLDKASQCEDVTIWLLPQTFFTTS